MNVSRRGPRRGAQTDRALRAFFHAAAPGGDAQTDLLGLRLALFALSRRGPLRGAQTDLIALFALLGHVTQAPRPLGARDDEGRISNMTDDDETLIIGRRLAGPSVS